MAQIIVDGTYWSTTGVRLERGVNETNDPELIREVLRLGYPWITVIDPEAEAAAEREREERFTRLVDTGTDKNAPPGVLTKADLRVSTDGLTCALCPELGPFRTQSGLGSHRRAKHPELDPTTGLPRGG